MLVWRSRSKKVMNQYFFVRSGEVGRGELLSFPSLIKVAVPRDCGFFCVKRTFLGSWVTAHIRQFANQFVFAKLLEFKVEKFYIRTIRQWTFVGYTFSLNRGKKRPANFKPAKHEVELRAVLVNADSYSVLYYSMLHYSTYCQRQRGVRLRPMLVITESGSNSIQR